MKLQRGFFGRADERAEDPLPFMLRGTEDEEQRLLAHVLPGSADLDHLREVVAARLDVVGGMEVPLADVERPFPGSPALAVDDTLVDYTWSCDLDHASAHSDGPCLRVSSFVPSLRMSLQICFELLLTCLLQHPLSSLSNQPIKHWHLAICMDLCAVFDYPCHRRAFPRHPKTG